MSSIYPLNVSSSVTYDVISFRKMIASSPQSLALAATQNDLATASGSVSFTGTIGATITGMVAPLDDELKILANDSTANVTLTHNDTASVAANRIHTETGAPFVLRPKTSILMQYRVATAAWRIVGGLGDDVRCGKLSIDAQSIVSGAGQLDNVGFAGVSSLRFLPSAPATVTGLVSPPSGQLLFATNLSAFPVTLNNEDSASIATNRIRTGTGGPLTIEPNAALLLQYNSSRWQVIGGTGGGADKIQTINSATSLNVTAWGSHVEATFTAAGQTLTIPTIGASDVGKTIKVRNAGAFDFTQAIASGSISSNVGLVVKPGQSLIIEAISTTLAAVLGTNAKDYTRTVQQLNATGAIAAWDSIVEIGAVPLTANITITLPACTGQTGKELTLKRLDNTTFTVTIAPNGADTTEVTTADLLNSQFGAIGLQCVSGTKSEQIYSIGAGGATIQQLNATGTVSRWDSVVEIGAVPLTANITITLPACANSNGKEVIFKRLDNTSFTVSIAPAATNTTEITTPSSLNSQFGGITVTCVSGTKSEQTSSIGGGAVDVIQTINSATSASVAVWNSFVPTTFTATGQTLTIPTIFSASIGKMIGIQNAGTNAFTLALQTGTLTSAIGASIAPGMVVWVEAVSTTSAVLAATNAAPPQITTSKSECYKNDAPGTGTPFTVATPVAGYTNERVNWDAPASNALGLTISSGVWQYPTAMRVTVRGSISPTYTTGAGDFVSLVEINTVTPNSPTILASAKVGQFVTSANSALPSGTIDWEFDCDPTKYYAFQFTGGYGSNIYNSTNRLNWMQTVLTGAVSSLPTAAAMQGQKVWADQVADIGNWILLDGRLKSALTTAQQAVATAIGYGANIPDMRGRMPLGALAGTYPLGTTGGSNTATIGQTNLPNINLTGGNHNHGISDPGHSHSMNPTYIGYTGSFYGAAGGSGAFGASNQQSINNGSTVSATTGISVANSGNLSIPLGGSGTALPVLNAYGTGNWFVWLGPSANSVTLITPLSLTTTPASAATFIPGTGVLNIPVGNEIGDAKSGFQATDHNGWILLNGRLKTTLTTTQQAAATSLGIGANLPDATGRGFVQGTLLAQIGSNLIARSDLPNVPITTDPGGNHTHSYLAANGSASAGVGSGSRLAGEISIQQNTATTTGTGAHTHIVQLNGNVTQTAYTPASIGCNQFIFLGL